MTVHAASSAESPVVPSAMTFVIARLLCVRGYAAARRPLISAPSAGRRGMRRRMVGLPIHRPRFIDIDRALQPVQLDDDREPHRGLPCCHGDDEDRENLSFQRWEAGRE